MDKKTFVDLKPGDIVYKACIYDYKTRINEKKIKKVVNKGTTVTIYCECKDSEYYQNFYPAVPIDSQLHLDKYCPNSYLCIDIENAKIACRQLANEMVSKTEKEITKLTQRLNKWNLHVKELYDGNYIIK